MMPEKTVTTGYSKVGNEAGRRKEKRSSGVVNEMLEKKKGSSGGR